MNRTTLLGGKYTLACISQHRLGHPSLCVSGCMDATVIQEMSKETLTRLYLKKSSPATYLHSQGKHSLLLLILIFMLLITHWIMPRNIRSGQNRSRKSNKLYWYTITAKSANQAADTVQLCSMTGKITGTSFINKNRKSLKSHQVN